MFPRTFPYMRTAQKHRAEALTTDVVMQHPRNATRVITEKLKSGSFPYTLVSHLVPKNIGHVQASVETQRSGIHGYVTRVVLQRLPVDSCGERTFESRQAGAARTEQSSMCRLGTLAGGMRPFPRVMRCEICPSAILFRLMSLYEWPYVVSGCASQAIPENPTPADFDLSDTIRVRSNAPPPGCQVPFSAGFRSDSESIHSRLNRYHENEC